MVKYGNNLHINNIQTKNFQRGIELSGCNVGNITLCTNSSNITRLDNNYGIFIGNSQRICVEQCVCDGNNHGIACGGTYNDIWSIPNRYITIKDCVGKSVNQAFGGGIEAHGNIEFLHIIRCTANGIETGGNHVTIDSCNIVSTANTEGLYFNEHCGFDIYVVNNTFRNPILRFRNTSSNFGSTNNRKEEIKFNNNIFEFYSSTGQIQSTLLSPSYYNNISNVSIEFKNNVFRSSTYSPSSSKIVSAGNIIIKGIYDNIILSDNIFENMLFIIRVNANPNIFINRTTCINSTFWIASIVGTSCTIDNCSIEHNYLVNTHKLEDETFFGVMSENNNNFTIKILKFNGNTIKFKNTELPLFPLLCNHFTC